MKAIIRKAMISDLECIRHCAEAAYSPYVERMGKKSAPMVADFKSQINKQQVDVLLVNAKLVGIAVWYLKNDCLFLENIALHPEHQGKGYGGLFFTHLEKAALSEGKSAIELYTNEKMTENLALYKRLGFQETGKYNQDGFSRVFFKKKLT